jgi:hypothetical protein
MENGVQLGTFTAQQLKSLADAGKIHPQTYVWKEGFVSWVPAGSLPGLLAPSAGVPAASRPRYMVLAGIILGSVLVVASLVVAVIILINQGGKPEDNEKRHQAKVRDPKSDKSPGPGRSRETEKPEPSRKAADTSARPDDSGKTDRSVTLVKTDDASKTDKREHSRKEPKKTEPPLPPPVEFKFLDLLDKYHADSKTLFKELGGKPVTVELEGLWMVSPGKQIPTGTLTIHWYKSIKLRKLEDSITFIFPLDQKGKLAFESKIAEYAKQRTKGEKVNFRVTGILTTTKIKEQTYLAVKNAFLN